MVEKPIMKTCACCKALKEIDDFGMMGVKRNGQCKACLNKKSRARVKKLGYKRRVDKIDADLANEATMMKW